MAIPPRASIAMQVFDLIFNLNKQEMSLPKFNPRTAVLFAMVLMVAILRLVFIYNQDTPVLSRISPLGAMAVFGGAYFSRNWKALGFPLLTLFVSDIILSFTIFSEFRSGFLYGGWYWTYGAFALMTLASKWLVKKITISTVLITSLTCVLIHWIVTDFGVWVGSHVYPQTPGGFTSCLIAAIPYELNLLIGTLLYSTILFGSFEWMQRKYAVFSIGNSN